MPLGEQQPVEMLQIHRPLSLAITLQLMAACWPLIGETQVSQTSRGLQLRQALLDLARHIGAMVFSMPAFFQFLGDIFGLKDNLRYSDLLT